MTVFLITGIVLIVIIYIKYELYFYNYNTTDFYVFLITKNVPI